MVLLIETLENNITVIKINRPDKRNALNLETYAAFVDAFRNLRTTDTRCVILTGEGTHFCAGGDVTEMMERKGKSMTTKERLEDGLNQIVREIRSLRIPVIAAVNGACFGAGLVLASASDLVYCNQSAKFGFAHGNIGLIPEGSYFLTRFLGLLKAKEYVFLRKVMTSEDAIKFGFVNDVFPDDELFSKVLAIANQISEGPTRTLGMAKEVLNQAYEDQLETHMHHESLSQGAAFSTEEHVEGVNAFLEKRKPKFS